MERGRLAKPRQGQEEKRNIDNKNKSEGETKMKKKILVLAMALALVAALAVPMAVFAGSTEVTGSVTQTTVEITAVPSGFALGDFVEGRNPSSDWTWSGSGSIVVDPGTDASTAWVLTALTKDDGTWDFSSGKMYCVSLDRLLDDAIYLNLYGTGAGYGTSGQAPSGATLSGSGDDSFELGAVQYISHSDAQNVGEYFILVYLSVAYTP
jgi:hypothetical protein